MVAATLRPNDEIRAKRTATPHFKELQIMTSSTRPVAANDNVPLRAKMLRLADTILKSNPETKPAVVRVRYRGKRPAWNWLRKQDELGAASLWLFARHRLPPEAANDNEPADGLGADRRKDGKLRGANRVMRGIDGYLSLPGIQPRLGDDGIAPTNWSGWHSDVTTIKPQRKPNDYPLHPFGSFTKCLPAVADGAVFLGAIGGLGPQKMGKRRGDVRRMEDIALPETPREIDTIIEVILSGGTVADIGRAFGARGGYADRRGGAALVAAGKWAKAAIAA
ncbi:hypothetical protein HFN45_32615 [Rhizobium leguminosarum]|nr:hypothetical protein [Rhizobium leguminosarum]